MSRPTENNAASAKTRRRGYRGLSAEQLSAQREQRLINAGTELFGIHGYAASTIEAVCSQANVSTRHFYEQFEGRESILHAVHEALVEQVQTVVRRALTESYKPMIERVADAMETTVRYLLDDPRRARILCIEAVGVSPVMEKKRRQTTHDLAAIISRYAVLLADSGALPQRDYHLPAVALVGMLNELMAEWLTEDTGLSAAEMAREAKIMFRAIMFGARHYKASDDPD